MNVTWAAVYLAILAFPALTFYVSSRVSPFFHHEFSRAQLLPQFSGYILGAVLFHGLTIYVWNLCPALPMISVGHGLELFSAGIKAREVDDAITFIAVYLLLVSAIGFVGGLTARWAIVTCYARKLFVGFVRPAHKLAFHASSWGREQLAGGKIRLVVCHVLSRVETRREERIIYWGVLYDAERAEDGGLGSLSLSLPEKFLLHPATGNITPAGVFVGSDVDSKFILQLPAADIENVLYEFIETSPTAQDPSEESDEHAPLTDQAPTATPPVAPKPGGDQTSICVA